MSLLRLVRLVVASIQQDVLVEQLSIQGAMLVVIDHKSAIIGLVPATGSLINYNLRVLELLCCGCLPMAVFLRVSATSIGVVIANA